MKPLSGTSKSKCSSPGQRLLLGVSVLASLGGCGGGDTPSQSSPAVATVVQTESPPDACQLLTADEIALPTGWEMPTARAADTGAAFVRSCNFADGADLASVVSVTVSAGGPAPQSAAAYAQSVGDNDGMLTEPATAVDGFAVPVIATKVLGGMHGMQARTPGAVELTVVTPSIETTRALFPKALARLLADQTR